MKGDDARNWFKGLTTEISAHTVSLLTPHTSHSPTTHTHTHTRPPTLSGMTLQSRILLLFLMQVRMPTLVIFCVRTRTRKSVRVHRGASHWRHIPTPASCTLSMCFHTENSYFGHEWIRIGKLILGCRVVPIIVDTQHDDKLVGRYWYVLAFAVFLLGDCIYQMRSLCKHFCSALIKWTKKKTLPVPGFHENH